MTPQPSQLALKFTVAEKIWDWVKRHKLKIILSIAGVIGLRVAIRYFQTRKLDYEKRRIEQEADSDARMAVHFDTIQHVICNDQLPMEIRLLNQELQKLMDTTEILEQLSSRKVGLEALSQTKKHELWQKLKVVSFSRTFCAAWSLSLLNLFIKVQTNILGKKLFLDQARLASSQNQAAVVGEACQRWYLSFSNYLPLKGVVPLASECKRVTKELLESKKLKSKQTVQQIKEIFMAILDRFERQYLDPVRFVLPFDNQLSEDLADISQAATHQEVMSSRDQKVLNEMLEETRRVLHSELFRAVFRRSIIELIDTAIEDLEKDFKQRGSESLILLELLPNISKIGLSLLEPTLTSPAVQRLLKLKEIHSLCSLVYSDLVD